MSSPSAPETPAETPTCYRHPDRTTYVSWQGHLGGPVTGATVAAVVLFTVSVWWRTNFLLAEVGGHFVFG